MFSHFQEPDSCRTAVPDPATWSLDGDAKLLEYMQSISQVNSRLKSALKFTVFFSLFWPQNLQTQSEKVSEDFNRLVCSVDKSSVELGNVASKLNQLQQNQFVENRVLEENDDDDAISTQVEDSSKSTNKTTDIEATKKLLDESVRMLNKCYEKVSLDEDDESDTEDDKLRFAYRPINPYEQDKRRPYIIGTKEWLEKYHIGLQSSEDDEQDESEEVSETESHATDQQPTFVEPIVERQPSGQNQYFIPPVPKPMAVPMPLIQANIPTAKPSIPINADTAAPSIFKSNTPAVSLFANEEPPEFDTVSEMSKNILFTESDDENQNFLPVKNGKRPAAGSSNFFSDEPPDETDQKEATARPPVVHDFFNQNLSKQIANQAATVVAKKVSNLFDSDEDEEKLPVPAAVRQQATAVVPTEIEYTLRRNEPITPKVTQEVSEKNATQVTNVKPAKKKITNLFDDDSDDDDFFLPSSKAKKVVQAAKKVDDVQHIEKQDGK